MTAEISPPSLSSSLDSLQSALIKSDRASQCLLLSPTSVATGDTGSTEEPYSASRSLAESVDRRSKSSEDQEDDFASAHESEVEHDLLCTPPPSSKRGLSPEIGSHAPRRAGMTTPSRSLVSDESWSQVASPLLRGREQSPFIAEKEEHDRIFIKEEDCSEDGREALRRSTTEEEEEDGDYPLDDYCLPITTSQAEAADYAMRTRRSQSDFSRWLEDTMAHARGDGTSTRGPSLYGSQQRRIDLYTAPYRSTPTTPSPPSPPSPVKRAWDSDSARRPPPLRAPESSVALSRSILALLVCRGRRAVGACSRWRAGRRRCSSPTRCPSSLRRRRRSRRRSRGERARTEVWADFIADLRARSPAPAPATEETPVPVAPSSRRWQILSCALSLAWLSTAVYSNHGALYDILGRVPAPEAPIYTPVIDNSTSATLLLDDFAFSPLTLGPSLSPLALLPITITLLLLALYHHHKLTSPPLKRPRSRSRSPSPLLELNPSSIESARALLPTAIEAYHAGELHKAIVNLTTISHLGCAPADKAAACQWRGKALYRLARRTGEQEGMEAAKKAFERAVRMDPASATARASLGRVSFRLGRVEEAVKQLSGAVKRDEELAFAHEYLGKAYAALSIVEGGAKQWINAEEHLRRAIALDPSSYTTLAFLGEHLHTRGRTQEARPLLEQAIALRQDYPAAHARLAFLATEQMDPARAATHLALVLSTRESGLHDNDLLPSTRSSLLGPTPFLSLYFALPTTDSSARLNVLDRARKLYPSSTLLSILQGIIQRQSHATSVKTSLEGLMALESTLAKRVERFGADDLEGKGLWALCLLGLNRGKKAERVYAEFWEGLRERKSVEDVGERELAQLVMAFYDCRSTRRVAAGRRKEM